MKLKVRLCLTTAVCCENANSNEVCRTELLLSHLCDKVRKGAIGAKCGLVFAYKEDDPFDAVKHFKRFKKYDAWDYNKYKEFVQEK